MICRSYLLPPLFSSQDNDPDQIPELTHHPILRPSPLRSAAAICTGRAERRKKAAVSTPEPASFHFPIDHLSHPALIRSIFPYFPLFGFNIPISQLTHSGPSRTISTIPPLSVTESITRNSGENRYNFR